MICYTDDLTSVREYMLHGFFVGWPRRPSPGQHLAVLRGSYRPVVAIDDADDRVAGFVNMLSDGVLTAFIPWLEVLPGVITWPRTPPARGPQAGTPQAGTPQAALSGAGTSRADGRW